MSLENEFTKVYDSLADAIFRHCYFKVSNKEKAQDIMQETFIKTWEFISKGGKIDNLKAFLYRVANNLIIDDFRKKKELSLDRLQEGGFEPVSGAEEEIKTKIEAEEVTKVIGMLDQEFREVIVMRHVEGMGVKEIASIIGESENLVSVRIHRGLAKLRELLSGPIINK